MDPITIAMIPATLTGLLHTWKSERSTLKNAQLEDFRDWLTCHHFDQLAELIKTNANLSHAIDETLRKNHDEVMAALEQIGSIIGLAMENSLPLVQIGKAMPRVSNQIAHFLRVINDADATEIMATHPEDDERAIAILDGKLGRVPAIDRRFFYDDIKTMIELGLLRRGEGDILCITRLGAAVGG